MLTILLISGNLHPQILEGARWNLYLARIRKRSKIMKSASNTTVNAQKMNAKCSINSIMIDISSRAKHNTAHFPKILASLA